MAEEKKTNPDLSAFIEAWPAPFVERQHLKEFSGGLIDPRTMANMDAKGAGPAGRVKIGRKVIYPVKSLVEWLESRATVPTRKVNTEMELQAGASS